MICKNKTKILDEQKAALRKREYYKELTPSAYNNSLFVFRNFSKKLDAFNLTSKTISEELRCYNTKEAEKFGMLKFNSPQMKPLMVEDNGHMVNRSSSSNK